MSASKLHSSQNIRILHVLKSAVYRRPRWTWIPSKHDSDGPSELTTQTASWSVQPFLYRWPQSVPILYNGTPHSPSKLPLPIGDLHPHLYMVPWAHPSPQSKRHLDRAGLTTVTDRPTDIPTDRPRYSVGMETKTYLIDMVKCPKIII